MKAFLVSLSLVLSIGSAVAGPSTSGGIAYQETFERCINKKLGTDIAVIAVASPETVFGFLSEPTESYHTLKCVEGKNQRSPMTGEELVWICNEQRPGEGQILVHINRTNEGVKYGILYRKNIIQQYQEMSRLTCDQLVSNK